MAPDELRDELAELRRVIEAQQAQIDALTGSPGPFLSAASSTAPPNGLDVAATPVEAAATSRRSLLTKGVVAGAVGVVGAAAVARPAAAADNDNVIIGQTNVGTSTTAINRSGSGTDPTLTVAAAPGNAKGIEAFSDTGIAAQGFSNAGDALFGQAVTGRAVVANGNGSATGLDALSVSGIGANISSQSGLPLVINPSPTAFGSPSTATNPPGAFFVDRFGRLFYNAFQDAPDAWLDVIVDAGPTFIDPPERGFDSRPGEPGSGTKGKFAAGETREIDLTLDTDVIGSDRGAVLNVTVTDTTNGGFASVYSAANPTVNPPTFASINWTNTGQTVGNHVQTAVGDGTIKIFTSQATHVIVDVIAFIV